MHDVLNQIAAHMRISEAGAATLLLSGGLLDVFTLVLEMKRVRLGKGASGVPVIPLFLYWMAVCLGKEPLPFYGHPALAFRFLNLVVMSGFHVCCQWLLPVMYREWFNGRSFLHWAVLRNDESGVERLLARGADPDPKDNQGWTPLHLAARKGYRSIAARLLNAGADARSIASERYSPLSWAVMGGHKEIVQMLISHGVDPLADEPSLYAAAREGHLEILELMLPAEVDLQNDLGNKLATRAIEGGQPEIARYLMFRGAKIDVNAKEHFQGSTLLYNMMSYGMNRHKAETAEFLISLGADVNARNDLGHSPLNFALRLKAMDLADVLRRHGAQE